ncbi:MAG: PilZ domain-containing protein [Bdellovibrionales bacterium]|nr:PilZ domain-containing protein [Bdellovibrionales bacterium]
MIEKRKYPRIEAKIKVSFHSKEELSLEYTRNISAGGIFLKTDKLLDPNSEIELTLDLPEKQGEVQIKGKVMRVMSMSHPVDPEKMVYGVGVRFINLTPEISEKIETCLQKLSGS